MGLIDDVEEGPVALDTSAVIYFIEQDVRYVSQLRPLFIQADSGERTLVTSALALHEVLILPFRTGNRVLAQRYEQLLTRSRGVRLVGITLDQLRAAARLRAATRVRTPDALHLTAAMTQGCRCFVTNDRRLPDVPGLRIIQLSSYA